MNKVVELTGCKSANSLTGSGKDDDEAAHLNLEVCSNKLLAELATYREQAEATSRKLANARDQLAKETVTEECLKRCATNLTVLAEADRTRRDCKEAELRTVAKRLTAELGVARRDADRLRTAVEQISDAAMGCGPVTCRGEGLREDNIRLQADLKANTTVEAKLRARIVQLETALQQTC
ncbi:hypothetical protein ACI65C_007587 [Semiaphis heraclei]